MQLAVDGRREILPTGSAQDASIHACIIAGHLPIVLELQFQCLDARLSCTAVAPHGRGRSSFVRHVSTLRSLHITAHLDEGYCRGSPARRAIFAKLSQVDSEKVNDMNRWASSKA